MTSQRSVAAQAKMASPRVALAVEPALARRPRSGAGRRAPTGGRWRAAVRVAQHAVELVLDVLVAHQAPPVDVEVARRDRGAVPSDPCELPDGGFGDDGHSTSRSRRVW